MVSYLCNTKEHDFENDIILKCTYMWNSNKYDLIFLRTENNNGYYEEDIFQNIRLTSEKVLKVLELEFINPSKFPSLWKITSRKPQEVIRKQTAKEVKT